MTEEMQEVNPFKWYNIKEILDLGVMPFNQRQALLALINDGEIPAVKIRSGKGTRYKIRGRHIIKYLNKYG